MKWILPRFIFKIERWKWNKEYRVYVSTLGHFKDEHKRPLPVKVTVKGYLMVPTACGLKLVHRIVMLTWMPIPGAEDLTVDHLDHNKRNNAVANLEWVTEEENQRRAQEDLYQDCLAVKPIKNDGRPKICWGQSVAFDTIEDATDWVIQNYCNSSNVIRKNITNKITNAIKTGKIYCGAKWKIEI